MGSVNGNNAGTGSIRESGMVAGSSNPNAPAGAGKKTSGFSNIGTAYGGNQEQMHLHQVLHMLIKEWSEIQSVFHHWMSLAQQVD